MIYDNTQAWKDVAEHFPNRTIYYIYLLKKGPTWSSEATPEVQVLQDSHLANLRRLGEIGKQELIGTDPMVKAGRLVLELHTWMVEKNILT